MYQRASPTSHQIPRFAFVRASEQDWGRLVGSIILLLTTGLAAELVLGPGTAEHGLRLFVSSVVLVCALALELVRQGAGGAVAGLSPAEQYALVRAQQSAPGMPVPIEGRVRVAR